MEASQEYYEAEFQASTLYEKIAQNPEDLELFQENDIAHEGNIYRYSVIINEGKRLQVTLELAEELKILQWQQISQADGEYSLQGFAD